MMWFFLLYVALTEQVIIDAADVPKRLILEDEKQRNKNPCEGYVQIYSGNNWGYVGDKYWNRSAEEVVCSSIHCGHPNGTSHDVVPSVKKETWLNELECSGKEANLWDCEHPGWNVSFYRKMTVKKITCSNQIRIYLEGFKCAGAVRYSKGPNTPPGYFCADNWGIEEGKHLCESLGCGELDVTPNQPWMVWENFRDSMKMNIQCHRKPVQHLWQCATTESRTCKQAATVICKSHKRAQLKGDASNACSGELQIKKNSNWKPVRDNKTGPDEWCQQLNCGLSNSRSLSGNSTQLKCSDQVKVVLMDDKKQASSCYGRVYVMVNNSLNAVCGSSWTTENANTVCKELNCGTSLINKTYQTTAMGILDYVACRGTESSLWHCMGEHHTKPVRCNSSAYVLCSGSIESKLVDGTGKCAGRLEVQYEGQWKRVYMNSKWTESNANAVCRQLGCGNARKGGKEKFSKGSGDFLQKIVSCSNSASKLSECQLDKMERIANTEETVEITCEEHKTILFVNESQGSFCSGRVTIEQNGATFWLSGSAETWNNESANTVCRQKHCGLAESYGSIPVNGTGSEKYPFSETSYSCPSVSKSLFDCENNTVLPNHNESIATVKCSGEVTVSLSSGCWGHVTVSMEGKSGGVCKDTWTTRDSVELCEQRGCGRKSLPFISNPTPTNILIKSVHALAADAGPTVYNFVKTENQQSCIPSYVICSGSAKPRFESPTDSCSGNVQVSHQDLWLPVCAESLKDKNTQDIICRELGCGLGVKNISYFGPESKLKNTRLTKVQCSVGDTSLSSCNITYSDQQSCTPGGLQCTNWRKIVLLEPCSGPVFVQSKADLTAVSTHRFTQREANQLCGDLHCDTANMTWQPGGEKDDVWNGSFSCDGRDAAQTKSIWDCEKPREPTAHPRQLVINCQGKPNVTLTNACHGNVLIDGMEVCDSEWSPWLMEYSSMVCQERNCSNAIRGNFNVAKPKPGKEYNHVFCEDHHYTLGQCKRYKEPCKGKVVTVNCVGKVKFKFAGEECGGQLQINYGTRWEKLCPTEKTNDPFFKQKLCGMLQCNSTHKRKPATKKHEPLKEKMDMALHCEDHVNIKHCVRKEPCKDAKPADVYCPDYSPPDEEPVVTSPKISVVTIILMVGFLLVVVIVAVVIVRICIVKKGSLRTLSKHDVEFESGEHEEIDCKIVNRHGDFPSEAEMTTERDGHSASSYDDIDELDEARPLTSQADPVGASGDSYVRNHSAGKFGPWDGSMYDDVDDPQENYDDIAAGPEATETQAEVHEDPKTAPESDAAAPPGSTLEDEDYLVPGQDG